MWMVNSKNKYALIFLLFLSEIAIAQPAPGENFLQGLAYYQQEMYDSALISFTISKGMNEKDALSWYYTGLSFYEQDRNRDAIDNFLVAEKLSPGLASFMLAKAYAREGLLDKSLEYLEINLKSNYKKPESNILLDKDLSLFENRKEWINFWRDNTYYSPFDKTLAEAAYLTKTEDYLEAIEVLSDGLKRGFRSSPIYASRAKVYLELENDELALKDLNDALDSDRRNPELYFLRGEVNYRLEKYKQAVEDFTNAIKYEPADFNAYMKRAMAYSKAGMYEPAREDMVYYLKYFPNDDEAWYTFGKINMEAEKYLDALRNLNKALEMNTSDPRYYIARGESYYNARTYRYASNDFSMALDLDPRNAEAYYLKGLTAAMEGNNELACFCFEKAYQYGKKEAFNFMGKYCKD